MTGCSCSVSFRRMLSATGVLLLLLPAAAAGPAPLADSWPLLPEADAAAGSASAAAAVSRPHFSLSLSAAACSASVVNAGVQAPPPLPPPHQAAAGERLVQRLLPTAAPPSGPPRIPVCVLPPPRPACPCVLFFWQHLLRRKGTQPPKDTWARHVNTASQPTPHLFGLLLLQVNVTAFFCISWLPRPPP